MDSNARTMMRAAGAAAIAASVSAIAAAGVRHQITDLGTLTDRTSVATCINSSGTVAGLSAITGGSKVISKDPYVVIAEPWFFHAFRWDGARMEDLGVLGRDVPPEVFPKPLSEAWSINVHGQIVGRGAHPFENYHGLLWLPEPAYGLPAGMNEVPTPPFGDNTQVWDINDAGQIVGEAQPGGSIGPRPYVWTVRGGVWDRIDLGDLGGPYGRAHGINNLGQAVGQANSALDLEAFIWLPEPAYGLPAGITNLVPQFSGSYALDINNHGQVIGRVGALASFLWLPEPAFGLPAGATMLDPTVIPSGVASEAHAISDDGTIVGSVYILTPQPFGPPALIGHAMIWRQGTMQLLEDLFPDGSGWMLATAYGVNDNGQIAGWGLPPGETELGHAFRIDPVPTEPADLDGDGDVDGLDLALLLGDWGFCAGCILPVEPRITCPADLNDDCQINGFDLAILLDAWT